MTTIDDSTGRDARTPAAGHTRRTFIRGIAATGASTAVAAAGLDAGVADLFGDEAQAADGRLTPFSEFNAIAPSGADAFEVAQGYRADVLMRYGDTFANTDGTSLTWGYNNDFLAFFPLDRDGNEGLLFANHEYPDPFLMHGNRNAAAKTAEQVELEQEAVGNSILHIKRDGDGAWRVISPSKYNRRITGDAPAMAFTGPLADNPAYPGIGRTVNGSVANCSGGITPWGTALSCEENYQDYAETSGFGYGWNQAQAGTNDYFNGDGSAADKPAKYGWVVEHDPYDPSDTGRKHTGLGRFRHENTAFNTAGQKFVLYMGDDRNNGGIYKFVSTRQYREGQARNNAAILTEGKLYVARFEPEGRRRFANPGDTTPISQTSGTGSWTEVPVEDLVDTHTRLRARLTNAVWDQHYGTNRPEDVEVRPGGDVFVALTNNSSVNDSHGSVRRMIEAGGDPAAMTFAWEDYAAGGPRPAAQGQGFSSPDNLVFDSQENLWVVTDISSSRLNKENEYKYHANNAMFMVPTKGPNAGVAYRFANGPIEAELTGPYFTPDESTLFINVQHPGEESSVQQGATFGDVQKYTSWWPTGNKTAGQNPSTPLPSLVAVQKLRGPDDVAGDGRPPGAPSNVVPVPPPGTGGDVPGDDGRGPRLNLLSPGRQQLAALRGRGILFELQADEGSTIELRLRGRLKRSGRGGRLVGRGKPRVLAGAKITARPGTPVRVRLRPIAAIRLLLLREQKLPATLHVTATDRAGNKTTRTKPMLFR
jgi:hypothetical protein